MIKKLTVTLTMTMILLILTVSCASPPILTPTPTPEPEIPPYYTTYTSEGLFSISYPPDWVPVTSIMGEVEEELKEWIKGVDPEAEVQEYKLLFMAGIPVDEGYYPSVNIGVEPRSIGYYTLDEITEAGSLWSREHLQRYRVHSQTRTFVDGREADITIDEDYELEYGEWRYITLIMVKDDFVWCVSCSSESEDFNNYEDIFFNVVRSIRLLN